MELLVTRFQIEAMILALLQLRLRACSPPRILQRRVEKTETKGRAKTASTHPFCSK